MISFVIEGDIIAFVKSQGRFDGLSEVCCGCKHCHIIGILGCIGTGGNEIIFLDVLFTETGSNLSCIG